MALISASKVNSNQLLGAISASGGNRVVGSFDVQ